MVVSFAEAPLQNGLPVQRRSGWPAVALLVALESCTADPARRVAAPPAPPTASGEERSGGRGRNKGRFTGPARSHSPRVGSLDSLRKSRRRPEPDARRVRPSAGRRAGGLGSPGARELPRGLGALSPQSASSGSRGQARAELGRRAPGTSAERPRVGRVRTDAVDTGRRSDVVARSTRVGMAQLAAGESRRRGELRQPSPYLRRDDARGAR